MKNKIIFYVMLMVAVLVGAQTQAALVSLTSTWSTNLNSTTIVITNISATAGTNAAVSFLSTPNGTSSSAGGLYNSFSALTLGANTGDSITLKFTTTFGVGGTATNLDRKFSFGLAGTDDKLFALLDSGVCNGTKLALGAYTNDIGSTAKTSLYRGDTGANVTNTSPTTTYTPAAGWTNGPDMTAGTYTLSLTRTATGADLVVSQTKSTGDNWTSTTRTLTTEMANAITLDKIFIGLTGSCPNTNFAYTVTDLSLDVIPAPPVYYTLTVNSGTGGGSTYTNGQQVTIAANPPAAGLTFARWTGDTQYVASVTASNTTVTMPSNAVTLTATYALPKPSGLVVSKDWNFDGDGAVGGTVDSGTSGTDWIKNSADSVLAQWSAGIVGEAFTNASRDSNLYVDTDAGTLICQSPVIAQNSRVKMSLGGAKASGWLDMRAKGEQVGAGGGVFSGQLKFLSTNSAVLAVINMRQNNQLQFITYGAVTNTYEIAGTTEVMTNYNGYQAAWNGKKISFYFDDEARGGSGATNLTDLAIMDDVASVQWDITTSGTAGKVTVDRMTIDVIPSAATYALTVNSGSGSGSYTNGQQVAITASNLFAKTFVAWTGDTAYLDNSNSASATVTMPAQAVNLTATYVDTTYALTVNNGTGDGSYTNGHVQAIAADVISGKTFIEWTGDTAYLDNSNSASATVTMPAQAVAVTATYVDTLYTLTVNSGSGSGSTYTNGQVVPITADAPASGYAFAAWTGDTAYLADSNAASTTVTMPLQAVTVTATYIATEQYTTNGTPYSWLTSYGLTNYEADAVLDQDNDGLKAWQEYIAGTNPTNAASVLKAAQATRNVVTWSAVSGRVYSVYWSTNLTRGFTALNTNIVFPQNSCTNTTPDARVNHYQVKVRIQQ